MREGAGLACWLLAEKQHVLGGGLVTHQVIRIKAGERNSLNTPARNSPHCYFPTPGSRVPEQYFSNFSCTRVTRASCSNADSDSMGQGWAQIPHFVPAPRLADAAVHGPHRSREGPENILAWPGCLSHQEPSHFLSSGFVSLLTPTGFSAPARWEQDRGRLMRSPRGRVERLSERVLPQFPCERDYPPGWAESWRGGGQAGCATGKFVPPSSFLGALQSSVQAAFYLAL